MNTVNSDTRNYGHFQTATAILGLKKGGGLKGHTLVEYEYVELDLRLAEISARIRVS